MKPFVTLLLALLAAAAQAAPACMRQSPAYTVPLVELYTSEGCDSCPPADRYLSTLRGSDAVVLSMHVDYWNYLGWKDPFARRETGERQRALADLVGSRTIYTPELFAGGRELRGGPGRWDSALPQALARLRAQPARAGITLLLEAPRAAGLPVEARVRAPGGGTLQLALVQNDLSVQVGAGENHGRLLHHDFVVRDWLAPVALPAEGDAVVRRSLMLPPGADRAKLAVVAFVQSGDGQILQALQLPLCGN